MPYADDRGYLWSAGELPSSDVTQEILDCAKFLDGEKNRLAKETMARSDGQGLRTDGHLKAPRRVNTWAKGASGRVRPCDTWAPLVHYRRIKFL